MKQFTPPAQAAARAVRLVGAAPADPVGGLVSLFFVLLLAQFGVRTVQPVVTLFVQQLVGNQAASLATLAGLAFSVTGVADLIASPFLGKRSDVIGYRRVLLICLFGAARHQPAAGLRAQLLAVRGGAVRRGVLHRRHPADGERAGRAGWCRGRSAARCMG